MIDGRTSVVRLGKKKRDSVTNKLEERDQKEGEQGGREDRVGGNGMHLTDVEIGNGSEV